MSDLGQVISPICALFMGFFVVFFGWVFFSVKMIIVSLTGIWEIR